MKIFKLLIGLLFITLFSNCEGLSSKKVVGKYYLVAVDDVAANTTLSYEVDDDGDFVGVIKPMVFSVGFDSNFIIAKQYSGEVSGVMPNSDVNFYIVVMAARDKFSGDKNVFGPFSEKEFYAKRKELEVPSSLDFTITIK